MLRTTPNLIVLRPADINEVIGSWDYIINNNKPVALVLAKDEAHILDGTKGSEVSKGAYIIRKETNKLDAIIVSTGIDITTSYLIREELYHKGIDIRLVSMPSVELFLSQPQEYQDSILPPNVKTFTVEASATLPWYRFASRNCAIGIDTFGCSGKKDDVLKKVKFDYDSILARIAGEFGIEITPEPEEQPKETTSNQETTGASSAEPVPVEVTTVETDPAQPAPVEAAPETPATEATTEMPSLAPTGVTVSQETLVKEENV